MKIINNAITMFTFSLFFQKVIKKTYSELYYYFSLLFLLYIV